MATNGIFCIEGEWDEDLRTRKSILPVLELLERLDSIKWIHRDAATSAEAENYLTKWSNRRYNDYMVLYIASHGDKGQIYWGPEQTMSLDQLADVLGDTARDCWVYFGSCLTLFHEKDVRSFVDKTGVQAVLGYRKAVDWLEAAAYEVILLSEMANHEGTPRAFFKRLTTRHGELASLLKFVVGTKTEILHATDARA